MSAMLPHVLVYPLPAGRRLRGALL
jgi:hypothetical protein